MSLALDLTCAAAGLAWGAFGLLGLRGLRRVPHLEPLDAPAEGTVAAVVAARDDAEIVGPTVDGLLAQQGVGLCVVAVDDRSADRTGEVLAERAARDERTRAIRVDALPDGWLGKSHACWTGAKAAGDVDWLLFVDADSRLGPDVVGRAVRLAERAGVAHVCLLPQLDGQSFAGRTVTLAMCVGLLHQAAGIESDRLGAYMGVGSFNLVRRDAYFEVGGHERLRLDVVEDVGLARILRHAGYRARVRFEVEDFHVRWITTLGSVFRVLEKNYFAIFRFRTLYFAAVWASGALLWLAAAASPFVGLAAAAAGLGGLAVFAASTVPVTLRYRWCVWHALFVPLAVPAVLAAMGFSAWRTLTRGGVAWRGTFYPLDRLRRRS